MSISHWPAAEKPREKLIRHGAETLSNAELLAIFIRTGVKGKTAVDIARELLVKHGSLQQFLSLPAKRFLAEAGLGEAKYATLQAALEINRRLLAESIEEKPIFNNETAVKRYFSSRLSGKKHEVFAVMLLDMQYRMIKYLELFRGAVNQAVVYSGEVVKVALEHHAAYVIAAHNHPTGSLTPSSSDDALTERLRAALELVDIELLDHYVV